MKLAKMRSKNSAFFTIFIQPKSKILFAKHLAFFIRQLCGATHDPSDGGLRAQRQQVRWPTPSFTLSRTHFKSFSTDVQHRTSAFLLLLLYYTASPVCFGCSGCENGFLLTLRTKAKSLKSVTSFRDIFPPYIQVACRATWWSVCSARNEFDPESWPIFKKNGWIEEDRSRSWMAHRWRF